MKNVFKRIFPLMLVALLTASCGGGGDTQANLGGGIGGTGISQGTVTGFGSVILNGVPFNTDTANFKIDDGDPIKGDAKTLLREGMQVKIRVSDALGRIADTVEFEPEVEGPVDARDDNANTLTVLGRTVVVDDNTKIEDTAGNPVPFNTLTPGVDMLEVSGLVFSDDNVQATHIKRTVTFISGTNGTEVEIKGKIASLDTNAKTFNIGTLFVNYSGATNLPPALKDNDFVEVKGTHDGTNTLNATGIEQEDAFSAAAGEIVEIEGLVTTPPNPPVSTTSGSFSVNGQLVTTDSTTVFEGGAPDDIADNVRLEVEGTMTADGLVLVAKKVQFRGNRIKIEATVDTNGKSTNPNTVRLLGIPVIINGATDSIVFSSINPNDPLKIKGYLTGTGVNRKVVATRVETNSGGKTLLQAPVDIGSIDKVNSTITLMGVKVNASSTLIFKDRNDALLAQDGNAARGIFFDLVKEGDLIKAKGPLSGADINAEEVEFEG